MHRPKASPVSRPYLTNGIFLIDLRGKESRFFPPSLLGVAAKYPGADLLITVVAEGKVILPPRALHLKGAPPVDRYGNPTLNYLQLSSDGLQLAGKIYHGLDKETDFPSYVDLCTISPADGRVRALTHNAFFLISEFDWDLARAWSPDRRQIAVVERLDKPPLFLDSGHARLLAVDTQTGTSQLLFEATGKQKRGAERIRNDRVSWAVSKAGERGVVFYAKDVPDDPPSDIAGSTAGGKDTAAWFFVPVPANPNVKPGPVRPLTEAELPEYGVYSGFPAAIVDSQNALDFDLAQISPQGDMTVFHRTYNGLSPVADAGPDGINTPWIEEHAGFWAVIAADGKTLLTGTDGKLYPLYDFTWDGRFIILEDEEKPRQYKSVNPWTKATQPAVVPAQVPHPWMQWLQLSPTAARRAATQWRHLPSR